MEKVKVTVEMIDMEEYYKIAEQVVEEIFDRECERSLNLVKKQAVEGALPSPSNLIDGTRSAILQITLAVCMRIQRSTLKRIQEKDSRLINPNPSDEYTKI